MVPSLLPVVLDFYRDPRRFPSLRDPAGPLPGGISELFNWVGGALDDDRTHGDAQQLGSSPTELHEAVRFFVKEVLFRADGDSYRTLGLDQEADLGQIKRHYRQLMSLFHPDRDTSGHNWETDYAPLINDAYNTLKRIHRGQEGAKLNNGWGPNTSGPRVHMTADFRAATDGGSSWEAAGFRARQHMVRSPRKNLVPALSVTKHIAATRQGALLKDIAGALGAAFTYAVSALSAVVRGLGSLVSPAIRSVPRGFHPGMYMIVAGVALTILFLMFKESEPPVMVLAELPSDAGALADNTTSPSTEYRRVEEVQAAQAREQEEQLRLAALAEKMAAEAAEAAEKAAAKKAAAEKAAAEAEAKRVAEQQRLEQEAQRQLAARMAEKAAAEAEQKRKAQALAQQQAREAEQKAREEAEARRIAQQQLEEERAKQAEARRLAAQQAEEQRLAALAAQAEAERAAKERELALQREQEAQEQEALRLPEQEAAAQEVQRLAALRAETAVKTLFTDLAAAYEAEDAGLFTTFFTADAVTSDAVGQEAILRLYEGFFAANEADEFSYRSLSWQRVPSAQSASQGASATAVQSEPLQHDAVLPDYTVTAKVTIATRARDGSGGRTIEVPITFRVTPMANGYAIASMEY